MKLTNLRDQRQSDEANCGGDAYGNTFYLEEIHAQNNFQSITANIIRFIFATKTVDITITFPRERNTFGIGWPAKELQA